VQCYERYRDRHRFVLRCDIRRYFPEIDHEILKAEFYKDQCNFSARHFQRSLLLVFFCQPVIPAMAFLSAA
jgi:hypothetical protein